MYARRATKGGKTARTEALPGFCKIEHGGDSGATPMMWSPLCPGGPDKGDPATFNEKLSGDKPIWGEGRNVPPP